MTLSSNLVGALLALASFGLYACSDVTIKFLGLDMTAVQIIFVASLCTLPMILVQAVTSPGGLSLRPALPGLSGLRVVLILINSVFVSYTFTKLPLAQAYAIFFCMPLLITLLAVPVLGEKLDVARVLAILVGFSGVLIALRPGSVPLQFAHLTAFVGATLGATNSILLRMIGSRERPAVMLLYPTLAQVVVLSCVMPFVWHPMTVEHWSLAALIGLLSVFGGLFIIAAYSRSAALVVAPMQYSQIIWGAGLGVLIFGETMDGFMILGISVIIAAGIYLLWRARTD